MNDTASILFREPVRTDPGSHCIETLKDKIRTAWNPDRNLALDLYEELLALERESGNADIGPEADDAIAERMAEDAVSAESLAPELLAKDVSDKAVSYLKRLVDAYRWKDNAKSVAYARAIVRIAESRNDASQEALGLMALGDSIAISGERLSEAWELQQKAANLYAGDCNVIGWARTVIGMTGICMECEHTDETLDAAYAALSIFRRFREPDLFVRLAINLIRLLNELGRFEQVAPVFDEAIAMAKSLPGESGQHLLLLYNNVAFTYWSSGEPGKSRENLVMARDAALSLGKKESVAIILGNLAFLESMRGDYNEALRISGSLLREPAENSNVYALRTKRLASECYLHLNRDEDALEGSLAILEDLEKPGVGNDVDRAHAYRIRGTAEANLGLLEESESSLRRARECFVSVHSDSWAYYVDTLVARVLIARRAWDAGLSLVRPSVLYFEEKGQYVNFVRARLVEAECLLGLARYGEALSAGLSLIESVPECDFFGLCYAAHVVSGLAFEGLGDARNAELHLDRSIRMIEEHQKKLAVTLKPEFLEDKCEAIHALVRMGLERVDAEGAFETVERLKAMTVLGYLANRSGLYWSCRDENSRALVRELSSLRNEYNGLRSMYREKPFLDAGEPSPDEELLAAKIRACEKSMSGIVEKLYLANAKEGDWTRVKPMRPSDVRGYLDKGETLVEYYSDGERIWAFVVMENGFNVRKLQVGIRETGELLGKLYDNFNFAITAGKNTESSAGLDRIARKICRRLYDALFAPLGLDCGSISAVRIVPFGLLHYVPYNLLFDGERYLVERLAVSTIPSAGLMARGSVPKRRCALVLAHTAGGALGHAEKEAAEVHAIAGGSLFVNREASASVLDREAVQVLHVAAHGSHRIDEPGMSYIRLDDSVLYTDDLLQKNLDYELVTLSACETGRVLVKKSEEMIGLSRGFLFAGAQSLAVSMWRIDDEATVELMKEFYGSLFSGISKAESLALAQRRMIENHPGLHPAFWGAFQLIGHAGPLSTSLQ